jgi:hypothetical protein
MSILGIVLKSVLIAALIGTSLTISLSACTSSSATSARAGTAGLTAEEKHRLYAAALAASESPLESATFKEVCRRIGIFDADGNRNDLYLQFVTAHLEWAMKTETQPFKREINTREQAREYLNKFRISDNPALTRRPQ